MSERRTSRRVPASTFSSLKVLCLRTNSEVAVVNISRGGALIECETRLVPGDRRPLIVEVNGTDGVRVAAHILRAEVAQIAPAPTYRAAVLFEKPLGLREFAEGTTESSRAPTEPMRDPFSVVPTLHSRAAFEQDVCRLLSIEAARIGPSLLEWPGCKSVYVMIPADGPRYLQVFFAPTAPLRFEHVLLLEQWARAASTLPREEGR